MPGRTPSQEFSCTFSRARVNLIPPSCTFVSDKPGRSRKVFRLIANFFYYQGTRATIGNIRTPSLRFSSYLQRLPMEHAETRMIQAFFASPSNHFVKILRDANPNASSGITQRPRKSKLASIFFLTSIFNHSIHSSIAVFYLGPHIHEKWKGRIETWQPRKRQRRRPRRNNWSFTEKLQGTRKRPL